MAVFKGFSETKNFVLFYPKLNYKISALIA